MPLTGIFPIIFLKEECRPGLGRLDLLQGSLLGCTRCYVTFAGVSGDLRERFSHTHSFHFIITLLSSALGLFRLEINC